MHADRDGLRSGQPGIDDGVERRRSDAAGEGRRAGFVARGGGATINIASTVALTPELLNGTYSGTKAYIVNFTRGAF